METTTRAQESKNPSPINSPRSNGSNNNNNGVHHQLPATTIHRSTETNPYPTTFVQADTTNFKHVVQMLTGSSETPSPKPDPSSNNNNNNNKSSFVIPPIKTTTPKKQQNNFKLYERRSNSFKNSLMINTLLPNYHHANNNSGFSPRNKQPEILSPSLLEFPKLAINSPVTPLNEDPFIINRSSSFSSPCLGNNSSSSEEDRAIAEKGFYLHPSPISTPREHEPQLLPLFPLSSPRVSGSSS